MNKWSILVLLALLAACGEGDKKGTGPAGVGGQAAAPPPAEVDVITVAAGSATITQDLPGRLQAVRSAQVRARVEGILEQRLFVEGSDIKAGTPLFRIDARTYRTALAAAEAERAAAQAAFDRTDKLVNIKYMSQQTLDAAVARVKQAEAAVSKAKLDLENAVPPAPISGRIGRALVTEGALVGKGEATHLATIEQLDPIRVEFTQSFSDLQRLQQAVKSGKQAKADSAVVELLFEDGSLYPEKGRLLFADQAVDPNSGAIILRAEFPNPRRELLPGAFARIRFPQAQVEGAFRVPQRAVQGGAQGQNVLSVDGEGKVVPLPVKTGPMSGSDFIITDGLKGGEQIIVNGLQKARPGAIVKPVPWVLDAPLLLSPGAPLMAPPQKPAEQPTEKK
jgi:membrane fusion protein (multidrug efflux system)